MATLAINHVGIPILPRCKKVGIYSRIGAHSEAEKLSERLGCRIENMGERVMQLCQ